MESRLRLPQRDWPLETLAEAAGLSRTVFANTFRDVVGCTPGAYLQRWRIGLVQKGLREGRPLKRLADEVGLDIAQVHLRRALGKDVLLIERFDRVRSDGHWHRRAMVSALTIFEFDEMMAAYASYEKLRVFRILCFCNLLGVIELGFKSNHKLTHGLFPVLNGHRPALAEIA